MSFRLLVAALLLAAGVSAARAERWAIVPEESSAAFRVRLFAVMPLSGAFEHLDGAITLDAKRERASVSARIRADSVRMASAKNTAWARSEEFFDAANHPEIRFESSEFPLALLSEGGVLEGTLSMRGVTEAVSFRVAPSVCDFAAGTRCAVDVSGAIERSRFGMRARRASVSDRVGLRLHIVAGAKR